MFSDADEGALHVRSCDTAVHLPGNAPADTYLRVDLLVDAARRAGADAVHPGYGFLAESAAFAQAVVDAGLTWVGPPAAAIAAMGSKIEAKALMRAAGVPVLPDSSVEGADDVAAIGFPMLVKASAGGGGRGMRIVRSAAELDDALAAAEREAASAFGDGTVFCERYVEHGRHIEIQVFGDTHGSVVVAARAGVLDPAPPPEDRRGGAVTGRRRATCGERMSDGRDRRGASAVDYVGAGHRRVPRSTPAAGSGSSR